LFVELWLSLRIILLVTVQKYHPDENRSTFMSRFKKRIVKAINELHNNYLPLMG